MTCNECEAKKPAHSTKKMQMSAYTKPLRPPAHRATNQANKHFQGEATSLPFDIISKIFYNGYRIKKGEILMTVELLQALLLILKACLE